MCFGAIPTSVYFQGGFQSQSSDGSTNTFYEMPGSGTIGFRPAAVAGSKNGALSHISPTSLAESTTHGSWDQTYTISGQEPSSTTPYQGTEFLKPWRSSADPEDPAFTHLQNPQRLQVSQ